MTAQANQSKRAHVSENPSPAVALEPPSVPNRISPEEVQKIGEEVREEYIQGTAGAAKSVPMAQIYRESWHELGSDIECDGKGSPVPENCGEPSPFPEIYLPCCQPKEHAGSHEFPPILANGPDVFWRCPRCSRSGRIPGMSTPEIRMMANLRHAKLLAETGDSCSCQHFTFSDTPADPVNRPPISAMALAGGASRMCARCTVLFLPVSSSAKFCEDCEIAATRGGVSRLPKDVVAAAAHLPAELAQSEEEKDATLRVYTDRIAALQKRCDLQARMHKEQVVVIQSLEQRIADLNARRYSDTVQGFTIDEEVIYPSFSRSIIAFSAAIALIVLVVVGMYVKHRMEGK